MIDTPTLLILGVALAIAGGALCFPSRRPAPPSGRRSGRAGRALIDQFEETGRESAGIFIETRLGEAKAAAIFREMAGAFAGPPAPPGPSASSTGPAPN